MKTRILSIFMVVTLVVSTAAMAQRPMGSQRKTGDKVMAGHFEHQKSNRQSFFTEEQKEAMKKFRLESAKEVKPLKNELRELQAKQQTLTTADHVDLKAINKNIDKMYDIKAEIAKVMAKQQQKCRSMLTEEQLIKFDNRKNRMDLNHRKSFSKERMNRFGEYRFGKGA